MDWFRKLFTTTSNLPAQAKPEPDVQPAKPPNIGGFAGDVARLESERMRANAAAERRAENDLERAEASARQRALEMEDAAEELRRFAQPILAEYHSVPDAPPVELGQILVFDVKRRLGTVNIWGILFANFDGDFAVDDNGALRVGTMRNGTAILRINTSYGPSDDDRPWKDPETHHRLVRVHSYREALLHIYNGAKEFTRGTGR